MKKFLWGVFFLLLVAAGGGAWWAYQSKDALIADAIRNYGPQITGVSVKLAGVKLDPTEGMAVLSGLELGNPKGFKTPHALVVEQLQIKLDVATLTRDVVHIQRITVLQPQVTYEHAAGGSNLDVIQRNVEAYITSHGASPQPSDTAPKKVIIDQFTMLGAKADVSAEVLQGKTVTVSLPDVHISDIGKKAGGVIPAEAAAQIVAGIKQTVKTAVTPLHLDGVVDRIKKGAASVVDTVKGFFK